MSNLQIVRSSMFMTVRMRHKTLRWSIPMGEIQSQTFQLDLNAPPKAGIRNSCIASDGALFALREHSKCTGFFRQLFLLVRQKNSWSLAVITGEFWRYLINIGMRREILRLLKLRPYR